MELCTVYILHSETLILLTKLICINYKILYPVYRYKNKDMFEQCQSLVLEGPWSHGQSGLQYRYHRFVH